MSFDSLEQLLGDLKITHEDHVSAAKEMAAGDHLKVSDTTVQEMAAGVHSQVSIGTFNNGSNDGFHADGSANKPRRSYDMPMPRITIDHDIFDDDGEWLFFYVSEFTKEENILPASAITIYALGFINLEEYLYTLKKYLWKKEVNRVTRKTMIKEFEDTIGCILDTFTEKMKKYCMNMVLRLFEGDLVKKLTDEYAERSKEGIKYNRVNSTWNSLCDISSNVLDTYWSQWYKDPQIYNLVSRFFKFLCYHIKIYPIVFSIYRRYTRSDTGRVKTYRRVKSYLEMANAEQNARAKSKKNDRLDFLRGLK